MYQLWLVRVSEVIDACKCGWAVASRHSRQSATLDLPSGRHAHPEFAVDRRLGMAAAAAAAASKKKRKGTAEEDGVPEMPTPEVLASDLPLADQDKVFRMTAVALAKEKIEKDQATHIKKELETEFGGMWHCILGACYGASITNETKSMLFFKTGLRYVLVFRTLDEEQQAVDNAPPPSGEGVMDDDDADAVEEMADAGAAAE